MTVGKYKEDGEYRNYVRSSRGIPLSHLLTLNSRIIIRLNEWDEKNDISERKNLIV